MLEFLGEISSHGARSQGDRRQRLAAYKVPREILFAPDLPKTGTGKNMRRERHNLDS